MTVRRVSRRRRRHLRKTRAQRGGDRTPQDANEWASLVKDKYATIINERYNYYDDKKGIMIDNIKDLPQTNKNMYLTLTDPSDNTQLSYYLEDVKAKVATFMINFINEEEHTSSSFINWYIMLDNDDLRKTYKETLLTIENGLRSLASVEPIRDIGDESGFPLYIWALVFSDVSILKTANNLTPELVSPEQVVKEIEAAAASEAKAEAKAKAEAAAEAAAEAKAEAAAAAEAESESEAQLLQLGKVSTQEEPALPAE